MPEAPITITFEPVAHRHLPMLRNWMEALHVREWWGDPAAEYEQIIGMLEGRDSTKPFIFSIDGRPTGYIQVWSIGDHQHAPWTVDFSWLQELPAETVGVDLMIGDEAALSKGIGRRVLGTFVDGLRRQGHQIIIIDPDPDNARAMRAYEAAGFRPIERLLGRTGDSFIMQHHLQTNGSAERP